jgi:hypothetical protein
VKEESTPTQQPHRCDTFEQKVSTTVQAMTEMAQPGCPPKNKGTRPASTPPPTPSTSPSTFTAAPAPAEQPRTQEPGQPSSSPPRGTPVDRAEDKRVSRGWKNLGASILQSSDTDCGEATLFTLKASKGNKPGGITAGVMDWLKKKLQRNVEELNGDCALKDKVRIDLRDGTTPNEMGALLGKQGMRVTGNLLDTGSGQLSDSLREGQMAVVLLDSNAVLPADKRDSGRGQLHWVTVAGIDDGGGQPGASVRYRVKDPSHGEYWVSANRLNQAVSKARTEHGSGGALLVDQDTSTDGQALAQENLKHTQALGTGNGGASRRRTSLEAG